MLFSSCPIDLKPLVARVSQHRPELSLPVPVAETENHVHPLAKDRTSTQQRAELAADQVEAAGNTVRHFALSWQMPARNFGRLTISPITMTAPQPRDPLRTAQNFGGCAERDAETEERV
jgi:hypothetical protein